ncbi:hypothetical protein M409DRAFT_50044 [Zasmidium cellare ATCC 36951]|uniref:Uncharacterized protein n=1 Tax=Zasmidium cellare ATCC 36951 TaxID=1080233 RepID=A0A6A6CZ61_ZASCE|nr:uncharacterized protein M409DRAFT_50044 [Zasmidium cellare ATCC 36951]KAF2172325.1 hypothetical protein M409DRAFT_50044 [Zasmidium cellare ATCC 36951]
MGENQAASHHEKYFNLGSYSRRISTKNSAAQTWFNRGLVWSYGFNHEEALQCFEKAIAEDPDCCMAHWGLAYVLGPNYNKPWEIFDEQERSENLNRARNALKEARDLAEREDASVTPIERLLIEAAQFRYREDTDDSSSWNQDYALAMSQVYEQFGYDLDVAALYADSLMQLTPWALWDIRTGEPSEGSRTLEAKSVLDSAISMPGGNVHPGLLHLYIHLMEMSASPESALPVADRLRGLVPDAGHLQHMPTHLDVLCGDWKRAMESNAAAIEADERYLSRAGALNFYSLYRSHNYHFRVYAAMFAGNFQAAIDTTARLETCLPDDLLRIESPPMADWLESFLSLRVHVLVRFGKWQDLLDLAIPKDRALYSVTTAMTYYGQGVALAVSGKVAEAEAKRNEFHDAVSRVPESRTLFNNTAIDILKVAAAMLDGELEYRRGNINTGFEHLRKAIALSDNLPYDEPWGWMQPPRHAYGALNLEQGNVEEALGVYKADLGLDDTLPRALRHPNNIWALHGYHECLKRLGRAVEAEEVSKQLERMRLEADVRVTSSCFCRRETNGV